MLKGNVKNKNQEWFYLHPKLIVQENKLMCRIMKQEEERTQHFLYDLHKPNFQNVRNE